MSYGNENFWESRRVWAAALTLLATIGAVLIPEQVDQILIPAFGIIASLLGLGSWGFPKE